ncbi:hypothetical protein [Bosea sp. TAB14]|uniref:hypothetical protein n=1 Tax=Bosea sp. TAB14 TaxID=3237481 RepID=UPI003F926271
MADDLAMARPHDRQPILVVDVGIMNAHEHVSSRKICSRHGLDGCLVPFPRTSQDERLELFTGHGEAFTVCVDIRKSSQKAFQYSWIEPRRISNYTFVSPRIVRHASLGL